MPLNLFYTMVQKSQKRPKTQIKGGGGPALTFLKNYSRQGVMGGLLPWKSFTGTWQTTLISNFLATGFHFFSHQYFSPVANGKYMYCNFNNQRKDQLVSLTLCFTTQQVDRQREESSLWRSTCWVVKHSVRETNWSFRWLWRLSSVSITEDWALFVRRTFILHVCCVILQIFGVVLFSVFSVVNGFAEIKKTPKCKKHIERSRQHPWTPKFKLHRMHRDRSPPKF